MARIIGDYIGTTFKDFLVLPGYTTEVHAPDIVDIGVDLAGVKLGKPLLPAAMRSVVGKELALAGSKAGTMPVAPRGLSIDLEAEIVKHVKDNMVPLGGIELTEHPLCILDTANLAEALAKTHEYGHSTIPVRNDIAELVGMFTYKPITHDRMDPGTPISTVMTPFRRESSPHCTTDMDKDAVKKYMEEKKLRSVPIVDEMSRLRGILFMQTAESGKIGAAIDSYHGWMDRAKAVVEAGADMLFSDTSDADSVYIERLVGDYKGMFPDGPPICAGNIVTADGFRRLADAGADVIKVGMGPGSICITNAVLGIGAPQFWAVREVCSARDAYSREKGKYIPIIADGGVEDTWDINVALAEADAVMGGRLFAGFFESAGALAAKDGRKFKEYWGEGSRRAAETSGNLRRYHMGGSSSGLHTYEGVDALVDYAGYLKPGVEEYAKAIKLALSHTGSKNMPEYRWNATLIRLTEKARGIAAPHGLASFA